ncbi:MAG TPA: hypothetical protein V6D09_17065 [Leptolyngbyaceae cyanobacterium]
MQDLLTAAIIAIALLFAAATTIDFATGLVKLWQDAGSKALPRVEAKPAIEQPAIANQVEPASALPDIWMQLVEEVVIALPAEQPSVKPQLLLAPAQVQVATLQWSLNNLPPIETFIVEVPCAIAMAKSRSPKVSPVIELATKKQLESCSIRRLKALARQIKLRGYGSMRLIELADSLAGKISLTDLAA